MVSPGICFQHIIHRSTLRFVSGHGPDTLHTLCHLFFFWPQSGENMTPVHSGRSQRTAKSPAGGEAEPCAAAAHGEARRAKTLFTPFFFLVNIFQGIRAPCVFGIKMIYNCSLLCNSFQLPGKDWNGVHPSFLWQECIHGEENKCRSWGKRERVALWKDRNHPAKT